MPNRLDRYQRSLLTFVALAECLAGLGILVAPGFAVALLIGAEANSVGLMIGRVLGVALLAIGISCWGARIDAGGPAQLGTLRAITVYNAGAGLLLTVYAASGAASGFVVWSAAALHIVLAAGFVRILIGARVV